MLEMKRTEVENQVKAIIVDRLNLQINVDEIESDAPIFLGSEVEGSKKGLGLDSVDALELVEIFESVDKITDFIMNQTAEE